MPWTWFLSDKVHHAVGGFAIVSFFYFIGLLVWAIVAGVDNVIPHGYARLFIIQMPVLLVLVLLTGVVCPVVLWSLKDFDDMYGIRRDCFFNIYGIPLSLDANTPRTEESREQSLMLWLLSFWSL